MKTRHYKFLEMEELKKRFADNPEVLEALETAQNALRKDRPPHAHVMQDYITNTTTYNLLSQVFYWEETPQGHAFWKALQEHYA